MYKEPATYNTIHSFAAFYSAALEKGFTLKSVIINSHGQMQ
jgi:hypothetical protein